MSRCRRPSSAARAPCLPPSAAMTSNTVAGLFAGRKSRVPSYKSVRALLDTAIRLARRFAGQLGRWPIALAELIFLQGLSTGVALATDNSDDAIPESNAALAADRNTSADRARAACTGT